MITRIPKLSTARDAAKSKGLGAACPPPRSGLLQTADRYDFPRWMTSLLGDEQEAALTASDELHRLTGGRLRLCGSPGDLPAPHRVFGVAEVCAPEDLRRARQLVQSALAGSSLSAERGYDLVSAVSESAMNSLVHARGGSVSVAVSPERDEIQVWIGDSGPGISPRNLHRSLLERGFSTAGSLGCGFTLILNLVDRVSLLTTAEGTTLVLSQRHEKAAGVLVGYFGVSAQ